MQLKSLFPLYFLFSSVLIHFSFFFEASGQDCSAELILEIQDADNADPLSGAAVWINQLDKGQAADNNGIVKFSTLCVGQKYTVDIHFIGYEELRIEFVAKETQKIQVKLNQSNIVLSEVVVDGERQIAITQATQQLRGQALSRSRGKSLGESLKDLPGLNSLQTGPGISKPVIQGLHSNRILILNNGIRQEGQQWGAEHAPEIDPFVASKITVIKGAEGVKYGPDAIGGVIILEPEDLRINKKFGGEINTAGMTNSRMGVFSTIFEGNISTLNNFGWRVQASVKRGGDFQAPDYNLMNTGVKELNFSLAGGWNTDNKGLEIFFSRFNTDIGILRSAHIGNLTDLEDAIGRNEPFYQRDFSYEIDNPRQELKHSLLKLNGYWTAPNLGKIKAKYGGQWNLRREFDVRRGGRSDRAAIDMDLNTHSLDLGLEHKAIGSLKGEVGITGIYQQNRNVPGTGVDPLIPFFNQFTTGIFLIEKYIKDNWQLEFGARYDHRELEVKTFNESNQLVNPKYSFDNHTFSIGGQIDLNESIRLSSNLGSAWRPPHVSELFSNGLHHGVAAIERGLLYEGGILSDVENIEAIKAESSLKWVNTLSINKNKWSAVANPYIQRINNFVYLEPKPGEFVLTVRGAFPLQQYVQTDAQLVGFDGTVNYDFTTDLNATLSYSMVRANDLNKNEAIIWMPADRYNFSLRKNFSGKFSPFIEGSVSHVARQSRVSDDRDFTAAPDAYQLIDLALGGSTTVGSNNLSLFIDVENLMNTSYRDYMNRLRYYADELGRNISIRFQYQF